MDFHSALLTSGAGGQAPPPPTVPSGHPAPKAGPIPPGLQLGMLDVSIPLVPGALGLNLEKRTCEAQGQTYQFMKYAPTPDGQPGPIERQGLLKEGDLLLEVNGERVLAKQSNGAVNEVKKARASGNPVTFRVLRPTPFLQLRGVWRFSEEFSDVVQSFGTGLAQLEASGGPVAATFHHEPSGVHSLGPFKSPTDAAIAFDDILLSSCGLRACAGSNFFRHWADRVRAAENAARSAEARGDVAGAKAILAGIRSPEGYTYAGSGVVALPSTRKEGWDACFGLPLWHRVRQERTTEKQYRLRSGVMVPAAPGLVALAPPSMLPPQPSSSGSNSALDVPLAGNAALDGLALRDALFFGPDRAVVRDVSEGIQSLTSADDDEDDGAGHTDVSARQPAGADVFASSYVPPPTDATAVANLVASGVCGVEGVNVMSVLPPGVAMPPPEAPVSHAEGGAPVYSGQGPAFPPQLAFPLWGPSQGVTSQAIDPHPGLNDNFLLLPTVSSDKTRTNPTRGPISKRARTLPPTTLYSVGPADASSNSSSSAADVAASAVGGVAPVRQSLQTRLTSVHGGPGEYHAIYRGVRHAADGTGAFAVFRRSIQDDFVANWPPRQHGLSSFSAADGGGGGGEEEEVLLNWYPTATQAALAYDRAARRVYADLLTSVNPEDGGGVHTNLPDWIDPPSVRRALYDVPDPKTPGAWVRRQGYAHYSGAATVVHALLAIAHSNVAVGRPEMLLMPREAWLAGGTATAAIRSVLDAARWGDVSISQGPPPIQKQQQGQEQVMHDAGGTPLCLLRAAVAASPPQLRAKFALVPPAELIVMALPPSLQIDPHPLVRDVGVPYASRDDTAVIIQVRPTAPQILRVKDQLTVFQALLSGGGDVLGPPPPGQAPTREMLNMAMLGVAHREGARPVGRPRGSGRGGRGGRGRPFRGRRGRGGRGGGRRGGDDDDEEDDGSDDWNGDDSDDDGGKYKGKKGWAGGGTPARRSGRANKRQRGFGDDDDDDGDDYGAEGEGGDGGEEEEERRPYKRKGPEPKVAAMAGDYDDYDGGAGGAGVWKVDRILAVRYADLPDPTGALTSEFDAAPDGASVLTDDEKARAHDKKQLGLRMALGHDARRGWESLEYLVRWKGLSYLHVEWVTASLLKEQGHWGKIRAQRFVGSELGARQLDDEEERMAAGRDPVSVIHEGGVVFLLSCFLVTDVRWFM